MSNVNTILKKLKKYYPDVKTDLVSENCWQLLVAVILSAQTTDKQVNKVTKNLFKKYKTPKDFALLLPVQLEKEIRSIGLYRAKAKNIIKTAQIIYEQYDSKVPEDFAILITLPGIGRKTANVVMYHAFNKIEGIAVDTHVKRLARRLGWTNHTDEKLIEKDLQKIIPKKDWGILTNLLIKHGRAICKAKHPDCKNCFLNKVCPSAFKV